MPSPHELGHHALTRRVLVGEAHDEIIAAESALRDAQLNADANALDTLLDDRLLFTGPNGMLASKADDLSAHQSGLVRFRTHRPEALEVRMVGSDVAIVALRAYLEVEVAGRLNAGTYRYTRVWARDGNTSWRVVGGHVSEVPSASR